MSERRIKPQKFGFNEIKRVMQVAEKEDGTQAFIRPFVTDEFAIAIDSRLLAKQIIKVGCPYIIQDFRIGIIVSGSADITINLVDRHVEAGMVALLEYGSIIQPKALSPDFRLMGVVISMDLMQSIFNSQKPYGLASKSGVFVVKHNEQEFDMVKKLLLTMWDVVKLNGYHRSVMMPSIQMLVSYLSTIHNTHLQEEQNSTPRKGPEHSHEKTVFNRFLELVHDHAVKERNIAYYAQELFLSPHYLSTLVKQTSGISPKEWIDRAITMRAKVMLKNSDMQAMEISNELGFPNSSFFSKFFKRMTGMTPQEYRQS